MTAPDDLISRDDALDAMCKGPRTVQERIDAIRAIASRPLTTTTVDASPAPQANGNALAEALKLPEVAAIVEWLELKTSDVETGYPLSDDDLANVLAGEIRRELAALKAVE